MPDTNGHSLEDQPVADLVRQLSDRYEFEERGVVAGRRAAPGTAEYLVDHTTFVFVVDPAGQLRFMFPGNVSVQDMMQGIAPLLQ